MYLNYTKDSDNSVSAGLLLHLDELLDSLGFDAGKTITASIVLPIANLLGLILCSLSTWIFFCGRFTDPIFVYYRVLSIVNILSLVHNIPMGIFFSPRYFPKIDTYATTIYQIYFAFMSIILFHLGETLQIGILLTKMKSFNSFLKLHFTASPRLVCFLFCLTSFLINLPMAFSFTTGSLGNYFLYDSNGNKLEATFYYFTSSEFATSSLGKLIVGITVFFMNLIMTLVIGIALNIISFVQYKASLKKRQIEVEALEMSSKHNRATTSMELKQQQQKAKDQRRIEKNMYMISILCVISILSRVVLIISAILFLFYYSFSDFLIIQILSYFIYFFVPAVSFFVFYFFNSTFKEEFNKILSLNRKRKPQHLKH